MTWKQLRKQFEQGSTDAYVLALYKEGRKWSKKETQIEEIELKVREGKEITPEQQEKLDSKQHVLSKLEEVGSYYGMYKKALKEQGPARNVSKSQEKEDAKAAPAKEEESKGDSSLTIIAQLITLQKFKGNDLNEHFTAAERDVLHKLLHGGKFSLASSISE